MSVVFNRAFVIVELFSSCADLFANKFVELLHRDVFNINSTGYKLKSVTFCGELVRKRSSRVLHCHRFVNDGVRLEDRGSVVGRALYQNRAVKMLRRQKNQLCSKEENMRLRTADEERVLHPENTSLFSTLKGSVYQRVLRSSADFMLWNKNIPHFPN